MDMNYAADLMLSIDTHHELSITNRFCRKIPDQAILCQGVAGEVVRFSGLQ
jgi:hypothetical protein